MHSIPAQSNISSIRLRIIGPQVLRFVGTVLQPQTASMISALPYNEQSQIASFVAECRGTKRKGDALQIAESARKSWHQLHDLCSPWGVDAAKILDIEGIGHIVPDDLFKCGVCESCLAGVPWKPKPEWTTMLSRLNEQINQTALIVSSYEGHPRRRFSNEAEEFRNSLRSLRHKRETAIETIKGLALKHGIEIGELA